MGLRQHGCSGRRGATRRQVHRPYRRQDRQITEAVEEKTDPFPQAHNHDTSEGGTNESGAIGQRGVEGQGVAQILGLVDEVPHQRLARGYIHGIDHSQ